MVDLPETKPFAFDKDGLPIFMCDRCGINVGSHAWGFCQPCIDKYSFALLKSTVDPFDYAMRLSSGEIIYYDECSINGDWVSIRRPIQKGPDVNSVQGPKLPPFERGVDIRLDDIVWVADAPYGS